MGIEGGVPEIHGIRFTVKYKDALYIQARTVNHADKLFFQHSLSMSYAYVGPLMMAEDMEGQNSCFSW